jgi:hypothetical protein
MRTIRSLVGLVVGLTILGGIASAVAAAMSKRQLVSRGTPDDDELDLVVIFDGLEFASRAPAFQRGSILTWYGGATIDLTGATLDPAGATLDLRTMFGGLQLLVPPAWPVDVRVVGVFAGVADTRDKAGVDETRPRLVLTGWAVAGGVGIMTADGMVERPVEQAAEAGAGG